MKNQIDFFEEVKYKWIPKIKVNEPNKVQSLNIIIVEMKVQ